MAGWSQYSGQAVHLPLDNVDTDQIIPARFMSVPRVQGYGPYLMHDLRRGGGEALLPGFALNVVPDASVLIAGRNFGSGSSREAAVYALVDAGFRVVIAPSFGDIFAGNAINNGLLPAVLPQGRIDALVVAVDGGSSVGVDLDAAQIVCGDLAMPLDLDQTRRMKLINGWDDIDLTLQHGDAIAVFRAGRQRKTWVWPA